MARVRADFGGLSILVNNAGIGVLGGVEALSLEDWRRVMAVNADSVFLGCKHALPLLRESQPASIVNISSIAGLVAGHNYAAYNASKAAVWLLTKSVALDCARQGIDVRCNSVHPTFIRTPILEPLIARRARMDWPSWRGRCLWGGWGAGRRRLRGALPGVRREQVRDGFRAQGGRGTYRSMMVG
jgi:NAD(P)-dependent dehydrogenase (short-subunit alcohol dehydrogenase family)